MSLRTDLLAPGAFLNPLLIEDAVRRALDEDLGRAGDVTSAATIPEGTKARARLAMRSPGVIAGLVCAAATFQMLDPSLEFSAKKRDGDKVAANEVIAEVDGAARAMLAAERVALDFVAHLSGIATLTAAYVEKV
ncbi:MAG: nicotinate-nucleotide diphosphorylase (carboxylating), partial [Xanthobacteraceae bacterium]